MIKKTLLYFLCLSLLLSIPACKKKLPTSPDIPTEVLPTITSFTASPTSITFGESSILSWSTKNATSISINQGVGNVSATGTVEVSPEETTTFILTATNSDGSKTQSCTIEVVAGVQSIAVISSSDMLYIGASETFTAVATMTDGSSKAVIEGVWSGDNPSVAMVEVTTGQVTIVGSGMVTISVTYSGKTGSKTIRGLPNYQGTWSGRYYIVSCNATGDFVTRVFFCDMLPVGTEAPIELNLIQNDDRVEGRFLLGELGANTSGPIGTDGQLLLSGAVHEGTITIEVAMLLQSAIPGQITGSLSQIWRMTELSGSGRIEANIQNLPRISTMTTTLRSVPRMVSPTLEDLVRALRRR